MKESILKEERSRAPVASIFKEPPGVDVAFDQDGLLNCPECAVNGRRSTCDLCDGVYAITANRLEAWNLEHPDRAWLLSDEAPDARGG